MIKILIVSLISVIVIFYSYRALSTIHQKYYFNNNTNKGLSFQKFYTDVKKQLQDSIIRLNNFDSAGYFDLNLLRFTPMYWWIDTLVFNPSHNRLFALCNEMYDPKDKTRDYNVSTWLLGQLENNKWMFYFAHGMSTEIAVPIEYSKESLSQIVREEFLKYYYMPYSIVQNPKLWEESFMDHKKGKIQRMNKNRFDEFKKKYLIQYQDNFLKY